MLPNVKIGDSTPLERSASSSAVSRRGFQTHSIHILKELRRHHVRSQASIFNDTRWVFL